MWWQRKVKPVPDVEPAPPPATTPMTANLIAEVQDEVRLIRTMASTLRHVDRVQLAAQSVCELAVELLGTKLAAVNLIVAGGQMTVAGVGISGNTELEASYCKYVVATKAPLAIEDALNDPLVRDNLLTLRDGIRTYLGVPLCTHDDYVLGALCVCDYVTRKWNERDVNTLTVLSRRLMAIEASALQQ